jgi:O-antigen/teichoic acid export membrane protein
MSAPAQTAAAGPQSSSVPQIRTAVQHSAIFGLGNILAKAMGFLMLPFYTRYLSPSDYGVLELLDLSMSLVGMFLGAGITSALLRSYTAATTASEQRQAVSTAFLFVAGTGISAFLIALAVYRPASALLFGDRSLPASYLLLSCAAFSMNYVTILPRTYLRALQASAALVTIDTSLLFLMMAMNIYFIAFLKIGVVGVLLSSVIAAGLQMVLLSAWTIRSAGIGFDMTLLRGMIRFGLPLVVSNLAMFALNYSDRFFLQHLRSLEMVGVYAIGYKFAFMMNVLLVQPFYAMWQSRMYIIHKEPDYPRVFGELFVLYCLVLTYAGLGLSLFSSELVRFMVGERFAASQDIIPLVALSYVCYGAGYYVQAGLFVTNNTNTLLRDVGRCVGDVLGLCDAGNRRLRSGATRVPLAASRGARFGKRERRCSHVSGVSVLGARTVGNYVGGQSCNADVIPRSGLEAAHDNARRDRGHRGINRRPPPDTSESPLKGGWVVIPERVLDLQLQVG